MTKSVQISSSAGNLLIAWLVSFIAAPLAVLGAVILTAAAIGGLMLAVL